MYIFIYLKYQYFYFRHQYIYFEKERLKGVSRPYHTANVCQRSKFNCYTFFVVPIFLLDSIIVHEKTLFLVERIGQRMIQLQHGRESTNAILKELEHFQLL